MSNEIQMIEYVEEVLSSTKSISDEIVYIHTLKCDLDNMESRLKRRLRGKVDILRRIHNNEEFKSILTDDMSNKIEYVIGNVC